jgi:hypothetical protein
MPAQFDIHFVRHGKFSRIYVSCKCVYKEGLSQDNIVKLLLALNDCKKFDYQGKYNSPEFIKYTNAYSSIGITLNIENTSYYLIDVDKSYPQIIELQNLSNEFTPPRDTGVIYELPDGRIDFMPYVSFIPWAWNELDEAHRQQINNLLGTGGQ